MLGEDRLKRPLAGPPLLVGQHEKAVARQIPHLVVDDAPLGKRVGAAQHVAHRGRREHRHDRREQFLRPELDAGHRPARVADRLLACVEPP
jgi:hypothetical protein